MRKSWQVKSDDVVLVGKKKLKLPLVEVLLTDEDTEGFGIQLNAGGVEEDDPGRCRFFGSLGEMERLHATLGEAIRMGKAQQEKELKRAREARRKALARCCGGTDEETPQHTQDCSTRNVASSGSRRAR